MIKEKKIGLSLSGGGYRSAAFQLGTLRKLRALGILDKIDVISTISGGSIAGAYYALHAHNFDAFDSGLKAALKKSVIRRIIISWYALFFLLALVAVNWAIWRLAHPGLSNFVIIILCELIVLVAFQFIFLPFTSLKIRAYSKLFFGDKKLTDLPPYPRMAINATNLETGTLWTYSHDRMGDSSYAFPKDGKPKIEFTVAEFPLARAVASSSCVPFPFNPVHIDGKFFRTASDASRAHPSLVDGGLYDNQGIHKITQPPSKSGYGCEIILCSDASQPFTFAFKGLNSLLVLYRTNDLMMRRIKNLQFISGVYSQKYEIAYYSLDWQYEECVTRFVDALEQGTLPAAIVSHHNIPATLLADVKGNKAQILAFIKNGIGYDNIIAASGGLSKPEIEFVCKVPTGLSAFDEQTIELLARHGATLTEIQIRLYCPTLLS